VELPATRQFARKIPRLDGKACSVQLSTASLLLAATLALAGPGAASADGKLEARYVATLAGLPIGSGTWIIDVGEGRYLAAASGSTSGLLRVFTGGQGTSAARGTLLGGHPAVSTYSSTITTNDKSTAVRLTIDAGNVKDSKLEPPIDQDPERIPITPAHEKGVIDPMTASLLRTPGNGNPVSSEACHRTLSIFDGRLRYDVKLEFKRIVSVKAERGYQGPVVVCAMYFTPVAGFIPSRTAIKYLAKLRDMEIWLAPIAGTRVLVPYRAEVPTPIGKAVLTATQFVSVASPARAAVSKPQ
jgi:hypothetical protein